MTATASDIHHSNSNISVAHPTGTTETITGTTIGTTINAAAAAYSSSTSLLLDSLTHAFKADLDQRNTDALNELNRQIDQLATAPLGGAHLLPLYDDQLHLTPIIPAVRLQPLKEESHRTQQSYPDTLYPSTRTGRDCSNPHLDHLLLNAVSSQVLARTPQADAAAVTNRISCIKTPTVTAPSTSQALLTHRPSQQSIVIDPLVSTQATDIGLVSTTTTMPLMTPSAATTALHLQHRPLGYLPSIEHDFTDISFQLNKDLSDFKRLADMDVSVMLPLSYNESSFKENSLCMDPPPHASESTALLYDTQIPQSLQFSSSKPLTLSSKELGHQTSFTTVAQLPKTASSSNHHHDASISDTSNQYDLYLNGDSIISDTRYAAVNSSGIDAGLGDFTMSFTTPAFSSLLRPPLHAATTTQTTSSENATIAVAPTTSTIPPASTAAVVSAGTDEEYITFDDRGIDITNYNISYNTNYNANYSFLGHTMQMTQDTDALFARVDISTDDESFAYVLDEISPPQCKPLPSESCIHPTETNLDDTQIKPATDTTREILESNRVGTTETGAITPTDTARLSTTSNGDHNYGLKNLSDRLESIRQGPHVATTLVTDTGATLGSSHNATDHHHRHPSIQTQIPWASASIKQPHPRSQLAYPAHSDRPSANSTDLPDHYTESVGVAPRGRVTSVNVDDPSRWKSILPQAVDIDQHRPLPDVPADENTRAVVNALRTLQERVGRLEGEKMAAKDKINDLEHELSTTRKLLYHQQLSGYSSQPPSALQNPPQSTNSTPIVDTTRSSPRPVDQGHTSYVENSPKRAALNPVSMPSAVHFHFEGVSVPQSSEMHVPSLETDHPLYPTHTQKSDLPAASTSGRLISDVPPLPATKMATLTSIFEARQQVSDLKARVERVRDLDRHIHESDHHSGGADLDGVDTVGVPPSLRWRSGGPSGASPVSNHSESGMYRQSNELGFDEGMLYPSQTERAGIVSVDGTKVNLDSARPILVSSEYLGDEAYMGDHDMPQYSFVSHDFDGDVSITGGGSSHYPRMTECIGIGGSVPIDTELPSTCAPVNDKSFLSDGEISQLQKDIQDQRNSRRSREKMDSRHALKQTLLEKIKDNTIERQKHRKPKDASMKSAIAPTIDVQPSWRRLNRRRTAKSLVSPSHPVSSTSASSTHMRRRPPIDMPFVVQQSYGDEPLGREMPFIVGQNTGKSFSVTANLQRVFSLLKAHNPGLCSVCSKRKAATCHPSHHTVEPLSSQRGRTVHVADGLRGKSLTRSCVQPTQMAPTIPSQPQHGSRSRQGPPSTHRGGASQSSQRDLADAIGELSIDVNSIADVAAGIGASDTGNFRHVLSVLSDDFRALKEEYNSLVLEYDKAVNSTRCTGAARAGRTEYPVGNSSGTKSLKSIGDELRLVIQNMETKGDQINILREILQSTLKHQKSKTGTMGDSRHGGENATSRRSHSSKRYRLSTVTSRSKSRESTGNRGDGMHRHDRHSTVAPESPSSPMPPPQRGRSRRVGRDTYIADRGRDNKISGDTDNVASNHPRWAVRRSSSCSPGRSVASLSLLKSSLKVQDALGDAVV
ncbi:hypothetical protein BASA50_001340 [Batrachochytrium salamandrivorans]|uniref:Cep57 centrosome microtubule-binding domain-containing protein n=1 Tax=Batrachochytrium salamandrivorans TaxID=1357716 RepID=A0ABQ8EXZ6_9FUNG|nr:hypothetical protein BASA50_001340 [Batrachochytrium salamandrivorans]